MMNPIRPLVVLVLGLVLLAPAGAQERDPLLSDSLWDGFDLQLAASKAHRALGYISPTLGVATYLSVAGGGEDDAGGGHRLLGTAAAWTAGVNLGLGLVTHWDRVDVFADPGNLVSRDGLHALLSGTGAVCMVIAGLRGGHDGHDFYGEVGTLLMGSAILLEW